MLALNFIPFIHLACVGWIACSYSRGWALACLYLLPPLLARTLLMLHPIKGGSYKIGSTEFMIWWATAQLQMIFCRLSFLEEALRLAPGCYSLWLRLWGARIGRLTFWAPGLRILDRSFLKLGEEVIFGTGVRLNAHVMSTDETGQPILHLAPISIGNRCQIGGYALLTAGAIVEAGENVHACALFPPFSVWKDGRRTKPSVIP